MTVSLDTNRVYLQNRLQITTGRMNDYADKSVDNIIQEEAKGGNTIATEYQRDVFGNTDELIESFKLGEPDNKYNVISSMSSEEMLKLLPMLESDALVMGLSFFTEEKILEMFGEVSSAEAVNVVLGVFPIEQIIAMLPAEDLEKFFQSDDVDKEVIIKQFMNMPTEQLIQMAESMTGEKSDVNDALGIIGSISSLPEKQYKETMSSMDPAIQMQIIYQMANEDSRILELFDSQAFSPLMMQMQKPDIVNSMVGLEEESLQLMIAELPEELFAIVASQIDTEMLAEYLMSDCAGLLESLGSK